MEQFAYSFAITMMHSIWQMALLLLFYYTVTAAFRNWPPLAKRNLLLFILFAQVLSSVTSFYLIYSKPFSDYREDIQTLLQSFSASQSWLQQYAPVLFALYTFGLLYKLGYTWFSWKRFGRIYSKELIKPSVDIRLFSEAKALHFGISKKVQVWCSDHIRSPLTYGYFKPVILLPVALVSQLNLQQTEALIVHELTHIRNNDYLFNWFILGTEAVFFFNPFVRIAAKKIRTEREKSCDIQVLQFNYPAISYAETLLYIAQQQQLKAAVVPVAAVNKKTELLDRIRYFSDDKNISSQQTRHFSFAALFIWSFIILNIFFAGLFVTNKGLQQPVALATSFAAAPLNEWNRSFSTEAVNENEAEEKTEEYPVASKAIASAPKLASAATNSIIDNEETVAVEADRKVINLALAPAATPLLLTPVSFSESQPAIIKDVIINEENSAGVTVTKAYRMISVNGEWKLEPLWMISELKPSDSLKEKVKLDSTVYMVIPTVQ